MTNNKSYKYMIYTNNSIAIFVKLMEIMCKIDNYHKITGDVVKGEFFGERVEVLLWV
jgi:hypothetical protein